MHSILICLSVEILSSFVVLTVVGPPWLHSDILPKLLFTLQPKISLGKKSTISLWSKRTHYNNTLPSEIICLLLSCCKSTCLQDTTVQIKASQTWHMGEKVCMCVWLDVDGLLLCCEQTVHGRGHRLHMDLEQKEERRDDRSESEQGGCYSYEIFSIPPVKEKNWRRAITEYITPLILTQVFALLCSS